MNETFKKIKQSITSFFSGVQKKWFNRSKPQPKTINAANPSIQTSEDTMSRNTKNGSGKKKFKLNYSNVILIVGIVIIMIPVTIFGVILYQAYMATGKPINGSRFNNERDSAIARQQLTEIENKVKANADIDKVTVTLKVATLRIYIDVADTIAADKYEALAADAYADVDAVLPIERYFTLHDSKKEYDLEIHVYNDEKLSGTDRYIYYVLNKNSAMTEPEMELVSKARNQELADELSGDTVSPGTVDGEDKESE